MKKKIEMVKPFEFSLKINDFIICKRFFNIKNYNTECRESLEMKEMVDEIMGVHDQMTLGIIPEFFKKQSIIDTCNSYNNYELNNVDYNDKDSYFTFELSKNNINRLKKSGGDFTFKDLNKEVIASGGLNGNLFHPNVRYEIDIRGIIPDIINVINKYLSLNTYTKSYGDVKLVRHNRLSEYELNQMI